MVKFARNTNYFGEWKKGVFAGEDYRVKLKGNAIFLHAGCRKDTLETSHGPYMTSYSLFVALSANGKTSTTCKLLARKGRERSWLIQDDGGTLYRDGTFRGFEAGGLFIKTDGLNPGEQAEAYYACLKRQTFLENVYVGADGAFDFYNMELTSNGRAVSAGDPTQAGKLKNEFFYDPFIAGDRSEHANLFYDILKSNGHIRCFLLNTGWVGEGEHFRDINLGDTMGILDSVLRGGLEDWMPSEGTSLLVPRAVRAVDSILFHPAKLYGMSEFEKRQKALDRQRAEIVALYPNLHPDIKAVFQQ
jgi:phosphoenolpyruvate carboxykinase (ATP)